MNGNILLTELLHCIKNSLVVTTLTDSSTRVSGVIIDDTDQFPIIHKSKIENAARAAGINMHRNGANKDCFALTFINGLCNVEEATLALFHIGNLSATESPKG